MLAQGWLNIGTVVRDLPILGMLWDINVGKPTSLHCCASVRNQTTRSAHRDLGAHISPLKVLDSNVIKSVVCH